MKNLILSALLLTGFCTGYADKYPRNYQVDIQHYAFSIVLSDETDVINVVANIRVLFKSDGIRQLRLDLINQSDSLSGKGMIIESASISNNPIVYQHKKNILWLTLEQPSVANTEIIFTIRYHGIPADGLHIGPTKNGDRSFFSDDWPNKARHWLATVDHPYDKATCEFQITAPSHYQAISNLLVETTDLTSTTRRTHWKQSVPISCWLYVVGVAEFAVQYLDTFEGKSIQTWVYAKDREAGFYDFDEPVKDVLGYFTDYVGPYAYEKVAQVQTTGGGGMEAATAIFYGEKLVDGKRSTRLRNVVIHELAHQWFGNAVTESTWDDAWLSEGFATFFTLLYEEHAYGQAELVSELVKSKQVVVDYYAKNPDYRIIADRSAEREPVTNGVTYQKGAWVLRMLREKMGEAAFQQGIRSYYKRFMNSNATTPDFQGEMEKASGLDLKNFFDQWLYRGGMLSLKGTWHFNASKKEVVITLEQQQPEKYKYEVALEIGMIFEGKLTTSEPIPVTGRKGVYHLPSDKKPDAVVPDPGMRLLADYHFTEKK